MNNSSPDAYRREFFVFGALNMSVQSSFHRLRHMMMSGRFLRPEFIHGGGA